MCSVVLSVVLFSHLDNVLFGGEFNYVLFVKEFNYVLFVEGFNYVLFVEEFNYVLFGGREKTVVAPGEGRPRLLYQPVPNSLPAQLLS